MYKLVLAPEVDSDLKTLRADKSRQKIFKAVTKRLEFLANDPKHKSLQTHPFKSGFGPDNERIWVSYAENKTPDAWRILWYYPKGRRMVIVVHSIMGHYD